MKQRYRLYRRKQSGVYYAQDNLNGKQESLHTTNASEAHTLLQVRNPAMNLQLAQVYQRHSDEG